MTELEPDNAFWDGEWISRDESNDRVTLNLERNFNKVLIVKINADFEIAARMIDRRALPRAKGSRIVLDWSYLDET